ncbi:hypothetical protein BP5796_08151 [Coleophoma crateriformis]|uniref:Uncharacterized protein n=1 Tax=Coleophoma crateriformis TaxID=565419 RepID=A0A3D8RDI3_9HELO|nr:hypothetical protein BP5796_08151 [Coleophoma crateriformis]
MSPLPPVKVSSYAWRQRNDSPSSWERRALAGENVWMHTASEHQQLYLQATLSAQLSIQHHIFAAKAKRAWRQLRSEVPELVLTPDYGGDETNGTGLLRYHDAHDELDISRWLDRTFLTAAGTRARAGSGHEALRDEIVQLKGEDWPGEYQGCVWVQTAGEADEVKNVEVLLNINHLITDGIGIRILLDKYLALLAEQLNPDHESKDDLLHWKSSAHNLSAPWIEFMNEDQVTSGPEYEAGLIRNQDVMMNQMSKNWGFPLHNPVPAPTSASPSPDAEKQRYHCHTLSALETTSLLTSIKQSISPAATVTHLIHAAAILALLHLHPFPVAPKDEERSTTLYSPCWLNGRRYLSLSPTSHPSGRRETYIPICQSFHPIVIPDLNLLSERVTSATTGAAKRELLISTCKHIQQEYQKLKERKGVLSEGVSLMEDVGRRLHRFVWRQFYSSVSFVFGPLSFFLLSDQMKAQQQQPPKPTGPDPNPDAQAEAEATPRVADPYILSDGLFSTYLRPSYTYTTADARVSRTVFTITAVDFTATTSGPNL